MNHTGKIALVTGANRSIGLEAVRGLARLGMTVYLGSRDEAAGIAAAHSLAGEGDVRAMKLDVTVEDDLREAVRWIGEAHGRLDVLINNAGIALAPVDVVDTSPDDLRRTLDTNLHGAHRLTQLAVPLLRAAGAAGGAGGARVVNVSSAAGTLNYIRTPDRPNPYPYILSKIGLTAMTAMFAEALKADGIKVNAVSPGYVNSAVSFFRGTRTAAQGARILIEYATIPDDGPTGRLWEWDGRELDW